MTSLFAAAARCLEASEPDDKLEASARAAADWRAGVLDWRGACDPPAPDVPAKPALPRLVPPSAVPRRRLGTPAGRIAFVHALAHIELNAIGLAWDCVCRFRGLPRAFYDDWVAVADDEARHFSTLRARLRDLGGEYGDLDAHDGLWEMAAKTAGDLAARLAMVPRVLEARALDVTPGMIERLRAAGDEPTAAILAVILEEEVAHVAAGSRWFRWECRRRGQDPDTEFQALVARYWRGPIRAPVNVAYRRRAGFSDAELA